MSNPPKTAPDEEDTVQIREVWDSNLETEFLLIRDIVDAYPFVAMDTEFPGIVCRPLGTFKFSSEYNYATLKANVDMLNLIQLGLTFYNTDGSLPVCADTGRRCVWQFNFCEFDVQKDMFATDSIELLKQSGIDFKRNSDEGVDVKHFAELLMSSGIVLNDCVHWVTFHSGYDFGYLLKLLTCKNLPDTQAVFFTLIKVYFPNLYDIKHLMKFCNSLHGGLNKLAELLEVERVGVCHQAGSDSLLTADTFRKLQESFFNGNTEKHAGQSCFSRQQCHCYTLKDEMDVWLMEEEKRIFCSKWPHCLKVVMGHQIVSGHFNYWYLLCETRKVKLYVSHVSIVYCML